VTNFLGRRLFVYFEGMWLKFPMVKKIYPSIKQITKFLFSPKFQEGLQKVVVVEYPRKGIYSLGFITNQTGDAISSKAGKRLLNVLIPSVPNPWSGFVLFFPEDEITYLDMSVETAVKIVVSGGVLNQDVLETDSSEDLF
ncbi:MAG TPA: DUF502 domain-containing protein, partial [Candidatus Omnitrophota bacterium]|nr:DUF502 domain-containing protein [Candidatus Omnitrophota bacterium]